MRGPTTTDGDYLETYLVNESMKWIDNMTQRGHGRPWYLYTSMVSPHPPNWVPRGEPWSSIYANTTLPPLNYRGDDIARLPYQTRLLLGLLGKEEDDPPAFPKGDRCAGATKPVAHCTVPNMSYIDAPVGHGLASPDGRYNYYALAAYVDHEVGRLLDFLDRRGLRNGTLVVFASDHGSMLFDHGIGNDKHNFLDASLRIPLIMRFPGVLPAGATRAFATTLDITTTLVTAAAGPDAVPRGYQGFDLVGPISQGGASPRMVGVSCEYRAMAVVTPRWKLAYFPEQHEGRLFDRRSDPFEQNDLYGNASVVHVKQGLLLALLRWRAQQDPIAFLNAHLPPHPTAPTAKIVVNHTRGIRGVDAELRLQEDALKF